MPSYSVDTFTKSDLNIQILCDRTAGSLLLINGFLKGSLYVAVFSKMCLLLLPFNSCVV